MAVTADSRTRPVTGADLEQSGRSCVLGVPIDSQFTMAEALGQILSLAEGDQPVQISFVNAHCINVAQHDPQYLETLRRSRLVLADGSGLRLAGLLLGAPVADNVNGTDMFPQLLRELEGRPLSVFLLGALPGIAERVGEWIARVYPRVSVAGIHHGHFGRDEEDRIIETIRASGARILLVAMGVPAQELWIARCSGRAGVRVAIGVGGLFDFYSGRRRRAPAWLRLVGLEWTFRLLQEPGRLWRRYLVGNLVFLSRVAAYRIRNWRVPAGALPTTQRR